ncbi:SycD/LcrH family type III secretion system chaperone [Glaciimonas sp. GG7]
MKTEDQDFQELLDSMQNGETIASLQGMSLQDLEKIYQKGHDFYVQGNYAEALTNFALTVYYYPLDKRFHKAAAACCQRLGRFERALQLYAAAGLIDPLDQATALYASECLIAMGREEDAHKKLTLIVRHTRADPNKSAVKDQAEALLAQLRDHQTA